MRALAWWAMAVAVCSPLFWFTALRPLSDMTGLAIVVAAQVMLMRRCARRRAVLTPCPTISNPPVACRSGRATSSPAERC